MVAGAQGRVVRLLDGMISSGRLPHSLIFAGPEGSGKELIAVDLAARLNCEAPGEDTERRCPACSKVRSLEHPDMHLVYPVPYGGWDKSMPAVVESRREDFFRQGEFGSRARSIGIDLVRRILEEVYKHPYEGRRAVVLLFEAHLATVEAQNALLKLLEEPPPKAVIVLVTEFGDRLLPTILSRCMEVRFDALSSDAIAAFLEAFYSVEKEKAQRLALIAGGNLRRGIRYLDERFMGMRDDAASLLGLVMDGNAGDILQESERLAGMYTRDELEELLGEFIKILRLLMRHQAGEVLKGEVGMLEKALGQRRLDESMSRNVLSDIRRINRAAGILRRNVDLELTLSQLLLDLAGKWY